MTHLALPLALARGLFVCGFSLILAILQDLRSPRLSTSHLGLAMITGGGLVCGTIAFGYAWNWAGRSGPVHTLTSRACGVALGYLAPSVITSHALYFHWAGGLEAVCANGLVHVFEWILHPFIGVRP